MVVCSGKVTQNFSCGYVNKIAELESGYFVDWKNKKNWQVTHIAPLQPPALATFLSWGIQQELAV